MIPKTGHVDFISSKYLVKICGLENLVGMIRWGVAGKADCRPLGGRQEMGPGSRAGQGAASKLQEIASYWLPLKTLSVTVQVFCD